MKNKKHPDSSGNKSSKAMSYSCLTNFFHKTLSHFFKKFVFINLMLLTIACKKEKPTEYDTLAFDMQVEDVSCTEVWLKVKLGENLQPRNITLKRENTTIFTGEILNSDTTFIDENLLPKRSYKYTISKLNELGKEISRDVVATTMDTTSHDFTWQIDTLGDGGGSVLYDVAIINDTLAYAVGEIYKRDSLGNWEPTPYGLAIWNGRNWTLRKLFAQYPGVSSPSLVRPHGIFAFSQTNIWFADADVFWWDGQSQLLRVHQVVNTVLSSGQYVDKLWGSSPSDIYAVGINGAIAHYDGARWRRLESGTDQNIQDIFGIVNQKTGFKTIFCVASHPLGYGDKKILSINVNNTVDTVQWPWQRVVMSVWFKKFDKIYTCGGGIFRRGADRQWKEIAGTNIIPTLTRRIRGVDDNDFFTVGGYGVVVHYNGASFRVYSEVPKYLYTSVDVKENIVVVVGYSGIVLIGIRNQ